MNFECLYTLSVNIFTYVVSSSNLNSKIGTLVLKYVI